MGQVSQSENIQHRATLWLCIPRSIEVTSIISLGIGLTACFVWGPGLFGEVSQFARDSWGASWQASGNRDVTTSEFLGLSLTRVDSISNWLVAFGLIMLCGTVAAAVVQGGMSWNWGAASLDASRMSPLGYWSRTWNRDRLIAITSNILSGLVGLACAVWTLSQTYPMYFGLTIHGSDQVPFWGKALVWLVVVSLPSSLAVAICFLGLRSVVIFRSHDDRRRSEQAEAEKRRPKYRGPRRIE